MNLTLVDEVIDELDAVRSNDERPIEKLKTLRYKLRQLAVSVDDEIEQIQAKNRRLYDEGKL